MKIESQQAPLDMLVIDVVERYTHRRQRGLWPEHKELLLRVLPESIKTSQVAIELAIEGMYYPWITYSLAQRKFPNMTLGDLSFDTVQYLSELVPPQSRAVLEMAQAYWLLGSSARISHRQIEAWGNAGSDRTNILSKWRADDYYAAINCGYIVPDPEHSDGEYVVYRLPRGVYQLLGHGIERQATESGRWPITSTLAYVAGQIGVENYLTVQEEKNNA